MQRQAGADYDRLERAGVVAVCAVGAKVGTAPGVVYHHVRVQETGQRNVKKVLYWPFWKWVT